MKSFLVVAVIGSLIVPSHASDYYRRTYCNSCYRPNVVYRTYKPTPTSSRVDNSSNYSYTYNISYAQPTTSDGTTVFGYKQSADTYNNVDVGALFNQATRLVADSVEASRQGLAGINEVTAKMADNAARVAEINARGAAAVAVLKATDPASRTTVTQSYTLRQQANGAARLDPPVQNTRPANGENENYATLKTIVQNRCAVCHNGPNANKIDLSDLSKLSREQTAAVLSRLIDPDPSKRMPKAPGDKPGTPLSLEELQLFFRFADLSQ